MSNLGLLNCLPKLSNFWVLQTLSQGWGEQRELSHWQAGWAAGAWRLCWGSAGHLTTKPCGLRRAPGHGVFSSDFAESLLSVPLACLCGVTPLLLLLRTL